MLLFAPEFMDEQLLKELPQEIRYYRFDSYGVDLCYYSNSKGVAISRILNHLNIDKENAMGIGDDYGDIPMFEAVGVSLAMGNGKEEVKMAASYVCDPIGEHGVEKMLKKLNII